MNTITVEVAQNVTVTYFEDGEYARQFAEEEAEQARIDEEYEIEKELRAWLRTHDASDPEYSDIYKDVYGFRP